MPSSGFERRKKLEDKCTHPGDFQILEVWPVLMSEDLSQQDRLRAITEKRKREAEIENKRRQLEDDRRQLQHLKPLLSLRLENGNSTVGKFMNKNDSESTRGFNSKALRERWLLDGAPSSGEDEAQKQLQEDEVKTKLLEKTILRLEEEIDELETGVPLNKGEKPCNENATDGAVKAVENGIQQPSPNADPNKKQITGIEAKLQCTNPDAAIENASADHPITMVFMGYQNVEDEAETKKALGIEETVKAEFVVIEDGESKGANEGAKDDKAPPNGSTSSPDKAQGETKEESKEEGDVKEKQSCKCCTVM
ncbi:hypothetical protein DNTS_026065 [Danionella cerebrum]|uniref:Paralemmin-1 n=1 Tax=Danionella cerebrum TaxID=2873325 RepID=A0A553Q2Q2_9TELE|nr:hypothetical protein DNTS_026065 [Danionella translucida]TRY84186.1 hypothetical protein DNTS_026065 [Danionella translucida]